MTIDEVSIPPSLDAVALAARAISFVYGEKGAEEALSCDRRLGGLRRPGAVLTVRAS